MTIPIKNHNINLWETFMPNYIQKINFITRLFLTICKEIANFSFWVIKACRCLFEETLMFICWRKINAILLRFLWDIPKISQTCYLGYFRHAWLCTPIEILSTRRKLSCLSAAKKSTSSPKFFWRYCKDIQTSYFRYFELAWLHRLKMIVSTGRKINFIIHFFLQILHFKKSYKLIRQQHFGPYLQNEKFCHVEISMTILVFILDYFQRKLMRKFFKSSIKP